MSDPVSNSLHKEFELERMILFSDAVFAIAITLLIIEIKFPDLPENYKISLDLFKMFKHTLIEFTAFILSFFFIGMSWARHLKMFRYLRTYDNGVIFRNLLSLIFIVAFPFFATGLTHIKPHFMFPMVIYLGNILLIAVSNFLLAHYIFKHKPSLSIPGHEPEKKYIYLQSAVFAISIGISFTAILITGLLTDFDDEYMTFSLYLLPLIVIFLRRRIKKYKPPPHPLSA